MSNPIDNMEAQVETNLARVDNCINPWCGNQIPSKRQIDISGVETCGKCDKVDLHEEER